VQQVVQVVILMLLAGPLVAKENLALLPVGIVDADGDGYGFAAGWVTGSAAGQQDTSSSDAGAE
jgi:hypothetical protein